MSLNYRLVRRPDMRKDAAEGSKLYYAQVRSLKKLKFEKFCNMVAVRSSAFVGDVKWSSTASCPSWRNGWKKGM